jgi:hypothetical protein
MGPFSLDPTVLYQFGNRAVQVPLAPVTATQIGGATGAADAAALNAAATNFGLRPGRRYYADLDAWLIDIRGGFQLGPLLLEAMGMYTTGNGARNSTLGTVRYFQPLTTDTGYLTDWGAQLTALGIDYLNAWNEGGGRVAYPGVSIGWDKYGRAQIGAKATYAITPALSIMGGANVHWTAEGVDRNGRPITGGGIVPTVIGRQDTSSYVGTELFTVLTWRFADGLQWDNSFGYMFAGSALDALTVPEAGGRNVNNPFILTSRIRFSF